MREIKELTEPLKLNIGNGYLIVEPKGAIDEYPGVWISFDKDGNPAESILCACVEKDTTDNRVLIETYCSEYDEPQHIHNFFKNETIL